jgi:hypothetical protein
MVLLLVGNANGEAADAEQSKADEDQEQGNAARA